MQLQSTVWLEVCEMWLAGGKVLLTSCFCFDGHGGFGYSRRFSGISIKRAGRLGGFARREESNYNMCMITTDHVHAGSEGTIPSSHEKYCTSNPTDRIGFLAARSEMNPTDIRQFRILASYSIANDLSVS